MFNECSLWARDIVLGAGDIAVTRTVAVLRDGKEIVT